MTRRTPARTGAIARGAALRRPVLVQLGDAAVVDERAQAGGEAVGLGEVDEVAAVSPLFDLHPADAVPEVRSLAGAQLVSEHAEARRVDAGHRRLDLVLQLTGVVFEQLHPVAEDDLLADVLTLELAR